MDISHCNLRRKLYSYMQNHCTLIVQRNTIFMMHFNCTWYYTLCINDILYSINIVVLLIRTWNMIVDHHTLGQTESTEYILNVFFFQFTSHPSPRGLLAMNVNSLHMILHPMCSVIYTHYHKLYNILNTHCIFTDQCIAQISLYIGYTLVDFCTYNVYSENPLQAASNAHCYT